MTDPQPSVEQDGRPPQTIEAIMERYRVTPLDLDAEYQRLQAMPIESLSAVEQERLAIWLRLKRDEAMAAGVAAGTVVPFERADSDHSKEPK